MRTVNLKEAKADLARLVDQAASGEPFVIAKDGKPLVRVVLSRHHARSTLRELAFLQGASACPTILILSAPPRSRGSSRASERPARHAYSSLGGSRIRPVTRCGTPPDRRPLDPAAVQRRELMEIAIKSSLRRDGFQIDAKLLYRGLLDSGYVELPVTGSHAAAITSLPPIHRDPFDRILVAQAMTEHLTLVTADETVARYSSAIRLV